MSDESTTSIRFDQFGLNASLIKSINDIGYEIPSPIQALAIPFLLAGRDVLGQAQTGTGKTAAFALPILSNIDLQQQNPQVLVLVPTRELAIQVAEAFQRYASHMKNLHVLPIYGGQAYDGQLRQLKRGAHIVVGTPGRVMDHMRRETLDLSELKVLVLDEADEMLRMGFIDDVKWVLEQTPPERQVALFSATMPAPIRRIAQKHLRDPEEITIQVRTSTASTIHQRYWLVSYEHKLDALTRILEFEPFDGMLIFVKTKAATVELAERLQARGHACAALNGDVAQSQRERLVNHFKQGKFDILVATDVAARGLDVDRISHVINYDIPYDTESYVHRVGRTGRAGRSGEAIIFISPRERRMLDAIEKATRQKIELLKMPTTEDINDQRVSQFKQRISDTLDTEDLGIFPGIIEQYLQDHDRTPVDVAAALARMLQGDEPFLLPPPPSHHVVPGRRRDGDRDAGGRGPDMRPHRGDRNDRPDRGDRQVRPERVARGDRKDLDRRTERPMQGGRGSLEHYRIEVGSSHGATPGNIVGAIANETGLSGKYIGQIDIHEDFSVVDLPVMSKDILDHLKNVWVANRKLDISPLGSGETPPRPQKPRTPDPKNVEAAKKRVEFKKKGPEKGAVKKTFLKKAGPKKGKKRKGD
ncbi:MAG: DEAD/DEAH box helicase [Candidatus Hydrogenedentes bacterium]|nr:DEAD/DEAH box helicase [Candidatus Hydrogenedentota bacterium]